jgi:hypothetical protein
LNFSSRFVCSAYHRSSSSSDDVEVVVAAAALALLDQPPLQLDHLVERRLLLAERERRVDARIGGGHRLSDARTSGERGERDGSKHEAKVGAHDLSFLLSH